MLKNASVFPSEYNLVHLFSNIYKKSDKFGKIMMYIHDKSAKFFR